MTALLLYRSCGKKSIPGCRKRNKECAQGYGSHTCAHQRDFADTAHSKSTKSAARTVSYGIFSSENSYLWTVAALTHSRAERVACDNLHLRTSAHHWHVSAFLCNRKFLEIPYYTKKHPQKDAFCSLTTREIDVREKIRTPDTLVRSQVLYPAELHTHTFYS